MAVIQSPGRGTAVVGPGYFRQLNAEEASNTAPFGPVIQGNDRQFDLWHSMALNGQTAVWSTTVYRDDATTADLKDKNIPVLQEVADAKTQALRANAQIAGLQSALTQLAAAPGQTIDMGKVLAAIDARVGESVKDSIASIDVTLNTRAQA